MAHRPCWAEISLPQLKENLEIVRRHVNADKGTDKKVLAVVKADAYGHGAVPVAHALEQGGVDALGVCCVAEGVELREGGVRAPIVVLTGFFPGEEPELVEHDITPGITDIAQVEKLEQTARQAGRKLNCHVKIDSGMGRLGVPPSDVQQLIDALKKAESLELEGLFTHFSSSENFTSPRADEQLACFESARQQLAAAGLTPPLVHLANTGATIARPETWGTMVRPGSVLYGFLSFFQFPEGQDRTEELHAKVPVKPVMTLKARIFQVKNYEPGSAVGYGGRFVAERPSRIAVLPIGYGDGWRRGLSGKCQVLVRGEFAPMVGTIGMDLTAVDVTGISGAEAGDEVVLMGSNGKTTISPSEVARNLGSVASEVLTGIGKRVRRVYLD
jgi:alanine racemase